MKILKKKLLQKGSEKTTPKQMRKITEKIENGPQNGGPEAVIFWSSGSFFLCQAALGAQMAPKASPNSPQDQSKPRFPMILGRFWMIF